MSAALDQGLIKTFQDSNFDIEIAYENDAFKPTKDIPYAELLVHQNDTTPGTLKHSNKTDGVFKVILRYPLDTGAVPAKMKADAIFAVYGIGQTITFGDVRLTIISNNREQGVPEEGWYKLVLTMAYRAFITRTTT